MSSKSKNAGVKHLLQCHCILPQYRNSKNPEFHKFVVFSVIDTETDTVIPKFVECNNCSIVHKVTDMCTSEFLVGRDEVRTMLSIEDFKYSLPSSLYELLVTNGRELPDFEYALFLIDNEGWDKHIVLSREEFDDHIQGKLVRFISADRFRVESYTSKRAV